MSDARVWKAETDERAFAVRLLPEWIDIATRRGLGTALREVACQMECVAAPVAVPMTRPGESWEVSAWKRGLSLAELEPSPAAPAVECLAELHKELSRRRVEGRVARADWRDRRARLQHLAAGATPAVGPAVADAFPELADAMARLPITAARALERADWDRISAAPVQLVHGDARPEHFLLEGERVTGVIDFDAMRIDTPLADVARLAGELALGDPDRLAELVDGYARARGTPIGASTVAAIDGVNAVLSVANWAGWLQDPQAPPRDPAAVRRRIAAIRARLPD